MLTLVTGGAASGKSAFAESLIVTSDVSRRVYIATMIPFGEEGESRVMRHIRLRSGKGFDTEELPYGLDRAALPENSAVLLEDIGNLVANECFSPGRGFEGAFERTTEGIFRLAAANSLTVAVTDEIGSDGIRYPAETKSYMRLLARVNAAVAEAADTVYEVVCGLPVELKPGTEAK